MMLGEQMHRSLNFKEGQYSSSAEFTRWAGKAFSETVENPFFNQYKTPSPL